MALNSVTGFNEIVCFTFNLCCCLSLFSGEDTSTFIQKFYRVDCPHPHAVFTDRATNRVAICINLPEKAAKQIVVKSLHLLV